jgi:hypothetical protein
MLSRVQLWSINHKKIRTQPPTPVGGIVSEFIIGADDQKFPLLPGYMDMAAPYSIWKEEKVPQIIGFHGYRKHINFRDPMEINSGQLAPGWAAVDLETFRAYQRWLVDWDALRITHDWLLCNDVLTVEPFDCSYNGGMAKDYAISRSEQDWKVLESILGERGFGREDFDTPYIRPMHFVCRDFVFCNFMRFWNDVRKELELRVYSDDARSPEAQTRALAFLSERIWSIWLDHAPVRIKTFPLMISWCIE